MWRVKITRQEKQIRGHKSQLESEVNWAIFFSVCDTVGCQVAHMKYLPRFCSMCNVTWWILCNFEISGIFFVHCRLFEVALWGAWIHGDLQRQSKPFALQIHSMNNRDCKSKCTWRVLHNCSTNIYLDFTPALHLSEFITSNAILNHCTANFTSSFDYLFTSCSYVRH